MLPFQPVQAAALATPVRTANIVVIAQSKAVLAGYAEN
jgi:hypothetical protein